MRDELSSPGTPDTHQPRRKRELLEYIEQIITDEEARTRLIWMVHRLYQPDRMNAFVVLCHGVRDGLTIEVALERCDQLSYSCDDVRSIINLGVNRIQRQRPEDTQSRADRNEICMAINALALDPGIPLHRAVPTLMAIESGQVLSLRALVPLLGDLMVFNDHLRRRVESMSERNLATDHAQASV